MEEVAYQYHTLIKRNISKAKLLGTDYHYGVCHLSYQDLITITNNFSRDNLLGSGYRWKVYRGIIEQGTIGYLKPMEVTIKIWDNPCDEDHTYFEDEWRVISFMSLRCLPIMMKLIGYCCEERMLAFAYEFASVNTLQDKLEDVMEFDWLKRLKVIVEVARGLASLHEQYPPFILRNLKPAHVLLDKNFNPKLFDFGLGTGGTLGDRTGAYLHVFGSDEYKSQHVGYSGLWSTKCDVSDFGITMLALTTMDNMPADRIHERYRMGWRRHGDSRLVSEGILMSDLFEASDLAVQCVVRPAEKRPSMMDVISNLDGLRVAKRSAWYGRGVIHFTETVHLQYEPMHLPYGPYQPTGRLKYIFGVCNVHSGMKHSASMYIDFPKFRKPSLLSSNNLECLTNNFSESNLLDQVNALGDFSKGKVYRGLIEKGSECKAEEVTVKIWDFPKDDFQCFEDEMMLLTLPSMSSHPNLVKLIGYCNEGELLGLVYECASLCTLRMKLRNMTFRWAHRIKAALGIAHALSFLHDQNPPFIHRNLDPAHILLDKDFNPRLFDFGSGTGGFLGDRVTFYSRFFGSSGFTDYSQFGTMSRPSCDVCVFGLLLLALISCRHVNDHQHITSWAEEQEKRDIVNHGLRRNPGYCLKDAIRVTKLALLCVTAESDQQRPTMKEIVSVLEGLRVTSKLGIYVKGRAGSKL